MNNTLNIQALRTPALREAAERYVLWLGPGATEEWTQEDLEHGLRLWLIHDPIGRTICTQLNAFA